MSRLKVTGAGGGAVAYTHRRSPEPPTARTPLGAVLGRLGATTRQNGGATLCPRRSTEERDFHAMLPKTPAVED
ncbi:MAG TPA: hypothetical protein VNX60_01650 [Candidatus Acidoferrum sp.]|nr:hypothetical protein [Candidatus Acidoferrum sp.]